MSGVKSSSVASDGEGGHPHQHINDGDARQHATTDGDGRTKRRISSLRQIVELSITNDGLKNDDGSGGGGGSSNQNSADDEGDFVFTDEVHGLQEFEIFSKNLANLGLVDSDFVEEVLEDQQERQRHTRESLGGKRRASSIFDPTGLLLDGNDTKSNSDPIKGEDGGDGRRRSSVATHQDANLVAYRRGQKESFLAVLDEIDKISHYQASKGLKNINFTFGLMNCLLIAYVFGAHPEHFWIVYALETVFWMAFKFVGMIRAKPLSEVLYYLDFCWVMNFVAVLMLSFFILVGDHMTTSFRTGLFMAAYGIYCGPVFLAAMGLPFVAFLFHDVNTMANLIIHLMPCMQMYVVRWHAVEVYSAWPNIFRSLRMMHQEMELGSTSTDAISKNLPFWSGLGEPSVARNALFVYFGWWIPYTLWMLSVGLKLPVQSKDPTAPPPKYDTVFHSLWRGGPCELVGKLLWKRPKGLSKDQSARNDFEVKDFIFYMTLHAAACVCLGIFLVGGLCSMGKPMHAIMLLITTTICADRGAQRYTYYVTAMYGQKLRKAFRELEHLDAMLEEDDAPSSLGTAGKDDRHRPKKE